MSSHGPKRPDRDKKRSADGASDNWDFLGLYSEDLCVDFHHATGYLSGASKAAHPESFGKRQEWGRWSSGHLQKGIQ